MLFFFFLNINTIITTSFIHSFMNSFTLREGSILPSTIKGAPTTVGSFMKEVGWEYDSREKSRDHKRIVESEENFQLLIRCMAEAVETEQCLSDVMDSRKGTPPLSMRSLSGQQQRSGTSFGASEGSNYISAGPCHLASGKTTESQYTTYSFPSNTAVDGEEGGRGGEQKKKATTAIVAAAPLYSEAPSAPKVPPPRYRRVMPMPTPHALMEECAPITTASTSNSSANLNSANSVNPCDVNMRSDSSNNSAKHCIPRQDQNYQKVEANKSRFPSLTLSVEAILATEQAQSTTRRDMNSSCYEALVVPHLTAYERVSHKARPESTTETETPKAQEAHRGCGGSDSEGDKAPVPVTRNSNKPKHLTGQMAHFLAPVRAAHKDKSSSPFKTDQTKLHTGHRGSCPTTTQEKEATQKNGESEKRMTPTATERRAARRGSRQSAGMARLEQLHKEAEEAAPEQKKRQNGRSQRPVSARKRALSVGTADRLGACLQPMSTIAQEEAEEVNFYAALVDECNMQKEDMAAVMASVYRISSSESAEEDSLSFTTIGDDNGMAAQESDKDEALQPSEEASAAAEFSMREKIHCYCYNHEVPAPQPGDCVPAAPPAKSRKGHNQYERIFKFSLSQIRRVRSPDSSLL